MNLLSLVIHVIPIQIFSRQKIERFETVSLKSCHPERLIGRLADPPKARNGDNYCACTLQNFDVTRNVIRSDNKSKGRT